MPKATAEARPVTDAAEFKRLSCSFCGKDGERVRFLAAGVCGGMICDRCCYVALFIFLKARLAATFRIASA